MTKKIDATETMAQSKEYMTKHIANSEKLVESVIEFNAAMFKSGETLAKKAYDNYISNVAASFDGIKALNKTGDMSEFYKVATSNLTSAAERVSDQTKEFSELASKVLKDTGEAGRQAYSKSFSGNL
ncbi:MAG: phasin family protein [Rhizobiaceae bacterium]|nr:phasin family protein [Rhizobiaceae bacterium]